MEEEQKVEEASETSTNLDEVPHIIKVLWGKKLLISQASVHLLPRFMIYEKDENSVAEETLSCPFTYPTVTHPSTILLLSGKGLQKDFLQILFEKKKEVEEESQNQVTTHA